MKVKNKSDKKTGNRTKSGDFDLVRLNNQLKISDSKVMILVRGNRLSLRGVFPPRMADDGLRLLDNPCSKPKDLWVQQKFSTGRTPNINSFKFLASFCLEITRRLEENTFGWQWFYEIIGKSPKIKSSTIQYLECNDLDTTNQPRILHQNLVSSSIILQPYDHTAIFPREFSRILEAIKDDRLNGNGILEDTWHREYFVPYTKFLEWCNAHNLPITTQSIADYLQQIPQEGRKRKRYYTSLRFLINYLHLPTQFKNRAGILCNIDRLASKYVLPIVEPESLPRDEVFLEDAERIKSDFPEWYSIYCYLLLYGVRNTELQHLDYSRYPNIFVKKSKTRVQRYVLPFKSQWIDELKIDSVIRLPQINRTKRYGFSHAITTFFRENIKSYTPLMMRHRFARCMAEERYDPFLSARMMGHSLEVHQTTYMKFVGLDSYIKALDINS